MPDRLPPRGTTERVKWDAFYGGVCCALSAGFYLDNGTGPEYVAVVQSVGRRELLAYARRENDMELPKLRRAVKWLEA